MRMQLTFRSGQQVEVDVEAVNRRNKRVPGPGLVANPLDDGAGIGGLVWETPGDWTAKLIDLNLSELVAVVVLRNEPDAPGADQ